MLTQGKILKVEGNNIIIGTELETPELLETQEVKTCEVRFDDGRSISALQRRKAYATIRDIADWCGDYSESVKEILKYDMLSETGGEYFSLGNCSMSQASEYITYLINFCVKNDVPCRESLLNRCEDIGKYLYTCVAFRRCAICGRRADIHEVEHVGIGNNRNRIKHLGQMVLPICRMHHREVHDIGEDTFENYYHVYPIRLDEHLCEAIKWRKEAKVEHELI